MGPSSKVADPFQMWFESLLIVAIHRDPLAKGPRYLTTAQARDPLMCDPVHSKFCIVWLAMVWVHLVGALIQYSQTGGQTAENLKRLLKVYTLHNCDRFSIARAVVGCPSSALTLPCLSNTLELGLGAVARYYAPGNERL